MRIQLVFCPIKGDVPYPPISLAYLSALLKQHDYPVEVLDLNGHLYSTNPVFCNEIAYFFANPTSYPHIPDEAPDSSYPELNNIDTIFNLNLLLHGLGLETLDPLHPAEQQFSKKLKKHVADTAKTILENEPKVVAFSTYISNVAYTCLLAKEIRNRNKDVKIVFGGSSTGYAPNREFFLKLNLADALVVGEGECALLKLLEDIKTGAGLEPVYGPMTVYDESSPEPQDCGLIQDLDTLPIPDFDGFNFDDYSYGGIMEEKDGLILPIAASRGCVGRCKYCSETNYWHRFRQRSVKSVINEIKTQVKKYNAKYFFFQDSLINGNKKWLREFCDSLLAENLNIHWTSYARIAGFDIDLLPKLKASGCHMLVYGVEHTGANVIKKSAKDMKRERVKEVLLHTAQAGIIPSANFIFGFPYEEDSDLLDMLYFVYRNEIQDNVICTFRPFELRVNSDLFIHNRDYEVEIKKKHQTIPESLQFLASAIDGINIYWKSTRPGYFTQLETKRNMFSGISTYQKSRWGEFKIWVRNFHFPSLLWEKINASSIPKLPDSLTRTDLQEREVLVTNVPVDSIQRQILTLVDNQLSLGQLVQHFYRAIAGGNNEPNRDKIFNEVKGRCLDLTLKGLIRWRTPKEINKD